MGKATERGTQSGTRNNNRTDPPIDADSAKIIDAWPTLPAAIRLAIKKLVEFFNPAMSETPISQALEVAAVALGIAKPIVETGCTFMESLLGEAFKAAGGMLGDGIGDRVVRNAALENELRRESLEGKRSRPVATGPSVRLQHNEGLIFVQNNSGGRATRHDFAGAVSTPSFHLAFWSGAAVRLFDLGQGPQRQREMPGGEVVNKKPPETIWGRVVEASSEVPLSIGGSAPADSTFNRIFGVCRRCMIRSRRRNAASLARTACSGSH